MVYTVSITSQGQISIPAPLRRKLGLDKYPKAQVKEEKGKIVIEPIRDLLEFRGFIKTKGRVSAKKIREAFGDYLAWEAVKNDPILRKLKLKMRRGK